MDIQATLKDAAYITIGLGVIGFQRAQVRRNELTKQLETQFGDLRKQVDGQLKSVETNLAEAREQFAKAVKDLEDRVQPIVEQFESQLDKVEGALPAQAKEIVHNARAVAKDAQTQVRSRLSA